MSQTNLYDTLRSRPNHNLPELDKASVPHPASEFIFNLPFRETSTFPKIITGLITEEYLGSLHNELYLEYLMTQHLSGEEPRYLLLAIEDGKLFVTESIRTYTKQYDELYEQYVQNQSSLVSEDYFNSLTTKAPYNANDASSGLFEYFKRSFTDFDKIPESFHWVIKIDLFGMATYNNLTHEDIAEYAKLVAFIHELSDECNQVFIQPQDITDYSLSVGLEY